MEVSILQHAKDTSPKAVGISEIVDLIRGDQWPPGYQPVLLVQGTFDGGTRQQNLTRLSGLSAAAFCHVEGSSLAELREEARADPHTLLLYTTGDSLIVIYPYELDVGYEVYLQRQFYQKAFLFGNDYYERLLGVQSVRKGKDAGKRCPLGHDAEAYYNPQAEPFLSWEIKEGCRRQTSQPKSTEGLRERKPNYREVYMSLDEIEQWLTQHIELRRNTVTMRKEYRWLAFKVENIESPRTLPFEYEGIYSQAYYLYRNGFEYWFSGNETSAIDERNNRFKVANLERQLVYRYYSHPVGTDTGEFVSVGDAMQHIGGNITQKLKKEAVDQAFIDLGFESMVCDGLPGYRAVRRMPKEIDALGRQMALRATQTQHADNKDPEIPDYF
jgi:hypothetical protein